ncbi:hypothetical protein [Peribacillus acanthi]|uniref:hypothetical protein n=1 Tax=Peribacillus acanthi TaxID=2171554 RepID=UPI000D3E5E73|nr:hypothetical protein [Peribacillus acanthi]
MTYTLEDVESHFKQQQQLYGNLADQTSFDMIFSLINDNRQMKEDNKRINEDNSRLASLNRHYLFKFFDGDVMKMQREFSYIKD